MTQVLFILQIIFFKIGMLPILMKLKVKKQIISAAHFIIRFGTENV